MSELNNLNKAEENIKWENVQSSFLNQDRLQIQD